MAHGCFISFEGIDGCGKSTQLAILAARLRDLGRDVVQTTEPGGTHAGSAIRAILLDPLHAALQPSAELLLYFASRAQNAAEVISPALQRGAAVLCDRFTDSTLAYQGAGRGLDLNTIRELHAIACGNLTPNLTLLLDIDPQTGLARARKRNVVTRSVETRLDDEPCDFFERVRAGYRALAAAEPGRIKLINAKLPIDEVAALIWEQVVPHV